MSDSSIEALLYEKESSSLDFKREQYPFDGASDDDKSELLKDILAFANAWRGTDAHILIGFEEVRGGRSRPIGVKRHLDDAKLQQFINSKLQKPLRFAYGVHVIDCVGGRGRVTS
jgi:predicted HTH transcriptional regulator